VVACLRRGWESMLKSFRGEVQGLAFYVVMFYELFYLSVLLSHAYYSISTLYFPFD
jgi:hypothetical protein